MRASSLTCLLLLAAGPAWPAATLGIATPPGASTIAYDINAKGQVAAVIEHANGRQRGVLVEQGTATALALPGDGNSDTRAINDNGVVVGSAEQPKGRWHAYTWERAGGMRTLGTLGGASSYGTAINRAGMVAGYADVAGDGYHAFVFDGTAMTDLGTLGGTISNATGINNAGQVAGTAALRDGTRRAFIWDRARGMRDLGTLGGPASSAAAINDAGMVVGAAETGARKWHAFLHDGQRMIDLGALLPHGESFATGINNAGQVVGTVQGEDERLTFVWRDGKMTVYRGGQGLYLVNRINDAGQVIGAIRGTRLEAAVLSSSAVPRAAPGVMRPLLTALAGALLAAGAVILWRRRYRGLSWRSLVDKVK